MFRYLILIIKCNVSRFSNVHGVEGARFSNQPYQGMYENMSTVNLQYSHYMPENNVFNIHDCPTPDNIVYEGAHASFYPGYAKNSEVLKKSHHFLSKHTILPT